MNTIESWDNFTRYYGGIDVYVSNGKLIQISQCKFFVDTLEYGNKGGT